MVVEGLLAWPTRGAHVARRAGNGRQPAELLSALDGDSPRIVTCPCSSCARASCSVPEIIESSFTASSRFANRCRFSFLRRLTQENQRERIGLHEVSACSNKGQLCRTCPPCVRDPLANASSPVGLRRSRKRARRTKRDKNISHREVHAARDKQSVLLYRARISQHK